MRIIMSQIAIGSLMMTPKNIVQLDGEDWIRVITAAGYLGVTSATLKKIIVDRQFEFTNMKGQKTLYMRYADFRTIVKEKV